MSSVEIIRRIGTASLGGDLRQRVVNAAAALFSAALLLVIVSAIFGSADMAGHITIASGTAHP